MYNLCIYILSPNPVFWVDISGFLPQAGGKMTMAALDLIFLLVVIILFNQQIFFSDHLRNHLLPSHWSTWVMPIEASPSPFLKASQWAEECWVLISSGLWSWTISWQGSWSYSRNRKSLFAGDGQIHLQGVAMIGSYLLRKKPGFEWTASNFLPNFPYHALPSRLMFCVLCCL